LIAKLYFAKKYNYSKLELTKIYQVHEEHMLHNAKKYNFSKLELTKIYQVHEEHMLHNASLISDKKTGRKNYKPFRQPMFRNFVYFLSSQSHLARKVFNLFRKI